MKKSNLYAERIFQEHPISLWSLDDEISFLQKFSSSQQNIENVNWNKTNISSISYIKNEYSPIINSNQFQVVANSASSVFVAEIQSSFYKNSILDFSNLMSTSCFSAYVKHTNNIEKYQIGISIDSVETMSEFIVGNNIWTNISHTFDIPEGSADIYFFIKIYVNGSSTENININAVSLGQWSESYISNSIGFNDIDLPDFFNNFLSTPDSYSTCLLDKYGLDNISGYLLVKNNFPFARPSGVPLVYGSSQSIKINNYDSVSPSLVFPGDGFLNKSGVNNNYTLEFWTRLSNSSFDPIRIIGPITSTDGIYLEEGFISVYVGPYTSSYFIGKWDRPMLIHFQYSPQNITLYINGEKTISIDIDIANISFPEEKTNNISNDWIGVYGSSYIDPFEIDCISIYPYLIPPEVAKKHFVYGQGVQEIDFSDKNMTRKIIDFDYPYSEYAFNLIYPDMNRWRSGFSVNMDTTSNYLKIAQHNLPEVIVQNDTEQVDSDSWFYDNRILNNLDPDIVPYIKMLPSEEYANATIYINNLNVLSEKLYSVFGTFKAPQTPQSNQNIFTFVNKKTGEVFKVYLDNNTLKYSFINQSGTESILHTESISDNDFFNAGINIQNINIEFYNIIGSFFSVTDKISLNIGSYASNIFLGKIYGIHFNNRYFYNKDLSNSFTNSFMNKNTGMLTFIEYVGNYSLLPIYKNVTMEFDIGATGYWEDVVPLSMFGKNITSASNTQIYDLDMIQFNIDAPYEQIFAAEKTPRFAYSTLYSLLNLYDKTYTQFNSIGYTSYQDIVDEYYNTYNNIRIDTGIKSYISLQQADLAGELLYENFNSIVSASADRVISLSTTSASTTKYEIFNNYIINIPKNINFTDYYVGIHLEMKVRGSITKNMIIKRMELSSFVFNQDNVTKIGTKYSYPAYSEAIE